MARLAVGQNMPGGPVHVMLEYAASYIFKYSQTMGQHVTCGTLKGRDSHLRPFLVPVNITAATSSVSCKNLSSLLGAFQTPCIYTCQNSCCTFKTLIFSKPHNTLSSLCILRHLRSLMILMLRMNSDFCISNFQVL